MIDVLVFRRNRKSLRDGVLAMQALVTPDRTRIITPDQHVIVPRRSGVIRYDDGPMRWEDVPPEWLEWQAAIVPSALATGDTGGGGATTLTFTSSTSSASAITLVFLYNDTNSAPTSVDGTPINVATFTQLGAVIQAPDSRRLYVYYGVASSAATGQPVITFPGSVFATARMIQATGTKLTGTNGVDAIVQRSTGQTLGSTTTTGLNTGANPITDTLAAFVDATNNAGVSFAIQRSGVAATSAGLTMLASFASSFWRDEIGWHVGQITSPDIAWGSTTNTSAAVSIELAAAAAAGTQWGAQMNHTWNRIVQTL